MRLACELPRPLKDEGEVPTCLEAFQAQLEGLATHFDRCIRWLDAPFWWARFECGRSIRVGLGDALPQLDRKGGVARSQLWELSKVVAAGPRKKGEIWEMWGATYGRNGWVGEKQIASRLFRSQVARPAPTPASDDSADELEHPTRAPGGNADKSDAAVAGALE